MGSAVVRNRLRRRLRALLGEMASADRLAPGWLLIGAQPSVVELTYDQLRAELRTLTSTLAAPVSR